LDDLRACHSDQFTSACFLRYSEQKGLKLKKKQAFRLSKGNFCDPEYAERQVWIRKNS